MNITKTDTLRSMMPIEKEVQHASIGMVLNCITAVATVGAVIVAMATIVQSSKNAKREILVGKIEEIYSLCTSLLHYYSSLRFLSVQLDLAHDQNFDANERAKALKEYRERVENFRQRVNIKELGDKTARLKVLANAYLQDSLKIQVLVFHNLLEILLTVSLQEQMFVKHLTYKSGFPDDNKVYKYVNGIEAELVSAIQFGKVHVSLEDIAAFRDKTFKAEMGLE